MYRKKEKKILFTNDEYQQPKRGNRNKNGSYINKKTTRAPLKSVNFHYDFNNYLKLALCKIISAFSTKITFVPSRDLVLGEEKDCEELKEMAA